MQFTSSNWCGLQWTRWVPFSNPPLLNIYLLPLAYIVSEWSTVTSSFILEKRAVTSDNAYVAYNAIR